MKKAFGLCLIIFASIALVGCKLPPPIAEIDQIRQAVKALPAGPHRQAVEAKVAEIMKAVDKERGKLFKNYDGIEKGVREAKELLQNSEGVANQPTDPSRFILTEVRVSRKEMFLLLDTATGKEFLGIYGVGLVELTK